MHQVNTFYLKKPLGENNYYSFQVKRSLWKNHCVGLWFISTLESHIILNYHISDGVAYEKLAGGFEPIRSGEKFQLMSMIIKDVELESSDGLHLINPEEIFSLKNNVQLLCQAIANYSVFWANFSFLFLQNYISFTPRPICDIYDCFYLYSGCRIQM